MMYILFIVWKEDRLVKEIYLNEGNMVIKRLGKERKVKIKEEILEILKKIAVMINKRETEI